MRKIPWGRKWQLTPAPVFLSGKSHRQSSPVGHSQWGCKRTGCNLAATKQQQQSHGLSPQQDWNPRRALFLLTMQSKVTCSEKIFFKLSQRCTIKAGGSSGVTYMVSDHKNRFQPLVRTLACFRSCLAVLMAFEQCIDLLTSPPKSTGVINSSKQVNIPVNTKDIWKLSGHWGPRFRHSPGSLSPQHYSHLAIEGGRKSPLHTKNGVCR